MKKRKLFLFGWISIAFISLTSGLIASIAWFSMANNLDLNVTGSVVEEWFHTGNGSAEDPFIITRPIHYYHLVEFFQRETSLPISLVENAEFGTDYLYFKVGYDIDGDGDLEVYNYDDQGTYQGTSSTPSFSQTLNMAYYSGGNALLPIGTNEVPFIGSFDGNASEGIIIANLNIHCAETVEIDGSPVNRAASDIGIFGYVSDDDGNSHQTVIKNSKFDGLTIDLTDVTSTVASSTINTVPHVSTHTGVAHVGYIAGHVHTYTNYVPAEAPASPTNASPLYDVYVTNATVQGGAGVHCDYGYIGLVDEIDGQAASTVAGEVSEISTGGGGGGGQGDDWGGSINFKEFNMRFYDNRSSFSYSSKKKLAKYSTNYSKVSLAYGSDISSNILSKNPVSDNNKIVYNLQGSGSHTMGTGSGADTYTLDGTAIPISIGNNGTPLDSNTGYIVSSSRTTSTSANGAVRSASYRTGYINNSLSDTAKTPREVYTAGSNNGELLTYDKTKTEILTNKNKSYDTSKGGTGNFVLIKDDMEGYNSTHTVTNDNLSGYTKDNTTVPGETGLNLKKYNAARTALDSVLTGTYKVQGIHFMNATISKDNTETLPTVKINKTTYTNSSYPLLKNCIDFNTKEAGLINFFGGTYYDHTVNGQYVSSADCFFSLYEVSRNDSTHAINSVKLLSVIYKDNRNSNAFIYQYSDGTYSDTGTSTKSENVGSVAFDMKYLSETPPVQNALYYFEIPVNKGEFALGGVSGQDGGAYLLYLDISASQGDETATYNQENMISDSPLFTQIDFQISDYVINSCFNVAYIIPSGASKSTFSITISCGEETIDGDDYTCYEVVIINTTGNNFVINALLMDNDDDNDNDYYYAYAITYNTGSRTVYTTSNTYTGASGGTSMTPTYTYD